MVELARSYLARRRGDVVVLVRVGLDANAGAAFCR
jgi:hypothetical protein